MLTLNKSQVDKLKYTDAEIPEETWTLLGLLMDDAIPLIDRVWILFHRELWTGDQFRELLFGLEKIVPKSDLSMRNYMKLGKPFFVAHYPQYSVEVFILLEGACK